MTARGIDYTIEIVMMERMARYGESDKPRYPEFYEPFPRDPHQSLLVESQSYEVFRSFEALFSDFVLRHVGNMVKQEYRDGDYMYIVKGDLAVEGQRYLLFFIDFAEADMLYDFSGDAGEEIEVITKSIRLQRLDNDYHGRENWEYWLGSDGVVRRWDEGDVWGQACSLWRHHQQVREELLNFCVSQDILSNLERKRKTNTSPFCFTQRVHAAKLRYVIHEAGQGVNLLPVSFKEIRGLKKFILTDGSFETAKSGP